LSSNHRSDSGSQDGSADIAESAPPVLQAEQHESDMSEEVSITESVSNSPVPASVGNTFILGRSKVDYKPIQDFLNKGYLFLDSLGRPLFRPPAGLQFPLEPFVSDVLERFDVQLHQLTPNPIACLSISLWLLTVVTIYHKSSI
jgi:hypothetical protein